MAQRQQGERQHLTAYALLKAIIGCPIAQINNPVSIATFLVSMAVHFLVADHRMMEIHKSVYQRIGRWALTLSILAGWIAGVTTVISPVLVILFLSFLVGELCWSCRNMSFRVSTPLHSWRM